MKKTCLLLACSILVLSSCADDRPSGEECETYETEETCLEAGCGKWEAYHPTVTEEDGQCVSYDNRTPLKVCLQLDEGAGESNAPAFYFRNSAPETDIRLFSSRYTSDPEGWTQCDGTCGCVTRFEAFEPDA